MFPWNTWSTESKVRILNNMYLYIIRNDIAALTPELSVACGLMSTSEATKKAQKKIAENDEEFIKAIFFFCIALCNVDEIRRMTIVKGK